MWFCDCKDSKSLSPVVDDLAGKHVMGSPEVHRLEFRKCAISVDPLLGLAL